MTRCPSCPEYNGNHGTKSCLRCPQFRFLLPRSQSVKYTLELTREVFENISDAFSKPPWSIVKKLPARQALIITSVFFLDLTHKELAEVFKTSRPYISKEYKKALLNLRKQIDKKT